ncbi:MAG TPA: DUF4384 domain-containing protein [Trueperaceae bacterium]|nr:DUF4384 domain-containing protein [Trueperaceae bacterium]
MKLYRASRFNRLRTVVSVALLAVLVSACTLTIQPGPGGIGSELNNVIVDFRPTRGVGAVYGVGEEIQFLLQTSSPGYVTLSAIDPDGTVYILSRNIPVPGGSVVLPTAEQRVTYNAAPPRGFHRVRASFTSTRTSETVVYSGRRGDGEWSNAISIEINPAPLRDVRETNLSIR